MRRRDGARRLVPGFAGRLGSLRAGLAIADIVVELGRPHGAWRAIARLAIARRGAGIRPAPMAIATASLLALTGALTGARTGGTIASIGPCGTIAARRSLGPLAATRPLWAR